MFDPSRYASLPVRSVSEAAGGLPQGISGDRVNAGGAFRRHASPFSLLVGALAAAALLALFETGDRWCAPRRGRGRAPLSR